MSNKFTTFFAMLSFLVLLSSTVFCEEYLYPYRDSTFIKTKWTTEEGLPQNTVVKIVQTQDGYIWLATFGGLVRFDGVRFTVFEPANTPSLPTARITAIKEDAEQTLWIGTEQGDVIKYKDGEFSKFFKGEKSSTDPIFDFIVEDGQVWIGGFKRLEKYNLDGKLIKNYKSLFPETLSIISFAKDKDGNLWLANTKGLIKLTNDDIQPVLQNGKVLGSSPKQVLINKKNEIIVAFQNKLIKISGDKVETIFEDNSNKNTIGNFTINDQDEIWINSLTSLYKLKDNRSEKYDLSDQLLTPARSLYFDRDNNLWIGANGDGLIQLKTPRVKTFGMYSEDKKRLFSVQSIIEDNEGAMWIGSNKLLKFENGEFSSYLTKANGSNSVVRAMAVDKQNTLWVGTEFGIFRIKDSSLEKLPLLSKIRARALTFDSSGVLWIGASNTGLHKLENEKLTTYTKENDGLVDNDVNSVTETKDGSLWIGTKIGMSRLKDGKFTNYNEANGFTSNPTRDIYEDSDGIIWIGTYGGGIYRLANDKFMAITQKHGLAENIASRLLLDDYENFWILGNKGVYTVSKQSLNDVAEGRRKRVVSQVYGVEDGMIISEGNGGNQPAGWKTKDGKLWFSTLLGGIIIDPKLKSSIQPSVLIEDITLENKKLDKRKQIEIPYDTGNLEIKYTALSFNKPKQTQFYYKMEGLDKDWINAGTRRKAIYPYIPPGSYKFSIKAINADGVWSDESSIIEITVTKPFWQQWWFILLSFLILAGVLFLLYRFRLNHLKKQQLKQQEFSKRLINAHESERQRLATELHDGLGQNLLLIKNWALLGINDSSQNGEVKKQLEEISSTATNALDETRTIVKNLRPQNIATFGLTATLKNMIEQIERSMGVVFETDIDNIDELFSDETEISVYRIVQECLNNIIKHSESPRAKVLIKHFPSKIEIFIQDFGKGFSTNKYFNSESASKGFGLTSISQRVKLLGGDLVINSAIDEGTKISIRLNVAKE